MERKCLNEDLRIRGMNFANAWRHFFTWHGPHNKTWSMQCFIFHTFVIKERHAIMKLSVDVEELPVYSNSSFPPHLVIKYIKCRSSQGKGKVVIWKCTYCVLLSIHVHLIDMPSLLERTFSFEQVAVLARKTCWAILYLHYTCNLIKYSRKDEISMRLHCLCYVWSSLSQTLIAQTSA